MLLLNIINIPGQALAMMLYFPNNPGFVSHMIWKLYWKHKIQKIIRNAAISSQIFQTKRQPPRKTTHKTKMSRRCNYYYFLLTLSQVALLANPCWRHCLHLYLINLTNLCNFQLFASNSEENISDQKLRNCWVQKNKRDILCKISSF